MVDGIERQHLLKRGVSEIIVESEFLELLDSGRPLRMKMGFDPSAPDVHMGHAVGLRKLRQFQDIGHKVVLIVGDWTAQIGDPSGRSQTRPMLTAEEVQGNAETYLAQFFKIVDETNTEIRWQSEWFGSFSLGDIIHLTSQFTVAQFLAREDFSKRFKANLPLAITELLYPLLQAYDSVAVQSDVEFGGLDQKFNLLVGRDLQVAMGQNPQQCYLVPLLPGTDGVQKMSKSLGNHIGIYELPTDMYGKVMSLPDTVALPQEQGRRGCLDLQSKDPRVPDQNTTSLILVYMEALTDVSNEELSELAQDFSDDVSNPMELKKRLARDLVAQFHGVESARRAQEHFERTVQRREIPREMSTYELPTPQQLAEKRLSWILLEAKLVSSASEARRLISQGAVRINDRKINDDSGLTALQAGDILKVGRRRFMRIIETSN